MASISSRRFLIRKNLSLPSCVGLAIGVVSPRNGSVPSSSSEHSSSSFVSCRQYTSTLPRDWWNPFTRQDSKTDSNPRIGSTRTRRGEEIDTPRRVQERKDVMLAMLALEFRRLSLEQPQVDRERIIDQAFESLEAKDLDSKTVIQLRYELQGALEGQVIELFQAMRRVDGCLDFPFDDPVEGNEVLDAMLRLELERTIDGLADPYSTRAPRGDSPTTYLETKRGALTTLLEKRADYRKSKPVVDHVAEGEGDETTVKKDVSWVESDLFGYHESIDEERNKLIRRYQAINICRAAKLRDDWGYAVVALRSSIAGAGRGVFVDGYAKAGSILAFQPGEVWTKENLVSLPVDVERQLEKNDHYQMSLRPDDYLIDSRNSPYTVLTQSGSNSMALGHVVNHPTPSRPPNARCVMINFTQGMDLKTLKQYIPNTYARPRNPTLLGNLLERGDVVEMQSMCLIASRDICNEEILYDYRLMTSRLPSWYHQVQDQTFAEETGDGDIVT